MEIEIVTEDTSRFLEVVRVEWTTTQELLDNHVAGPSGITAEMDLPWNEDEENFNIHNVIGA